MTDRINAKLDGQDDILQAAQIFDCRDWPHNRNDLAHYGTDQINRLIGHFANVLARLRTDVGFYLMYNENTYVFECSVLLLLNGMLSSKM